MLGFFSRSKTPRVPCGAHLPRAPPTHTVKGSRPSPPHRARVHRSASWRDVGAKGMTVTRRPRSLPGAHTKSLLRTHPLSSETRTFPNLCDSKAPKRQLSVPCPGTQGSPGRLTRMTPPTRDPGSLGRGVRMGHSWGPADLGPPGLGATSCGPAPDGAWAVGVQTLGTDRQTDTWTDTLGGDARGVWGQLGREDGSPGRSQLRGWKGRTL